MAIIVTPGQLKEQGEFYHQLASMTKSGVTIIQSIGLLRKNPPSRKLKHVAEQIMQSLIRGSTFTEALQTTGRQVPEFDVALIEAGEASGRLDQCFKLLADFYDDRGRLASKIISELVYPIFLFHFALLIFPTSLLADFIWYGKTAKFVIAKLAVLVPTYAVVIGVLWSLQSERSKTWRAFLENLFSKIPVIGKTQQYISLARLSAALEALINAGVMIIEAWTLAARASGSQRIMRAVEKARPQLERGELPSEAIQREPSIYPDLFMGSYRTGEVSGQLDEALRRLYQYYLEAATTGLHRIANLLPKLIYMGVMIGVAYQIVQFYSGYFGEINKVIEQ